jgi:hypothetical protein
MGTLGWQRYYIILIGVHVLEIIIISLAVAFMEFVKPSYSTVDVLVMIAVGMLAGAGYVESMRWIERYSARV